MDEGPGTGLQLLLFEVDQTERSGYVNTIEFYDLTPRFIFGDQPNTPGSIEREFQYDGQPYKIRLLPTQIRMPDGTERFAFPGEREQLVEDVIRRLAVDPDRLRLDKGQDTVQIQFTLYELRQELRRVRHTLAIDEIREALEILHRCTFEVTKLGTRKPMISATAFPVLLMSDTAEVGSKRILHFNPLVAEGLRRLKFRQLDYERLMRLKTGPARWLYKRMVQRFTQAGAFEAYEILATTIARDSGMTLLSRNRDTLRKVDRSVEALIEAGIVESVTRQHRKVPGTKRLEDVLYIMYPSREFMRDQKAANAIVNETVNEFKTIAGTADTEQFVRVPAARARAFRAQKRGLNASARGGLISSIKRPS